MAKPKHNYKSKEFLDNIESLAKKGYTDGEIAFTIGLSVSEFSRKKTSQTQIEQALTRGRQAVNTAIRQTYLAVALGKVKTKTVTKKLVDGENEPVAIVFETETEQPPNPQALATWLFNHDEEWRQKTMDGKRLDLTTNGKDLFASLTDEQLEARIAELEKKVKQ